VPLTTVGAHKAQGVALQRVHLLRVAAARLFNRQRFAGQRGLSDKQIARLNDAQVRRDHVPAASFTRSPGTSWSIGSSTQRFRPAR
jgi:hypothetical protein